ncbi:Expansin protein [Dioscorea alata]|uniref:Expansin protein n=1 Tax=Dioscorea alata TaxID=55571 RepID=A0ACB7UJK9_DIOAL|nr:Expansin protein [Dioscorea alata]
MAKTLGFFMALLSMASMAVGRGSTGWEKAFATFYGDISGGETMEGACGYGDLFKQGYGLDTAALSTTLFNNGHTCGACYELKCTNNPEWCINGKTTTITATNFCPPNWSKPSDMGGWCNPPRKHFDMAMAAFLKIVKGIKVGIVPVHYRRVKCVKKGGIKFEIKGNPYWNLVLVYNVGGVGDVKGVWVKKMGDVKSGWIQMTRNWGQNWQTGVGLRGWSLSFRVSVSDGRTLYALGVVPVNWNFGQSFESKVQF